MFARTKHLLLRPGWMEDAPALASAIGDAAVTCHLASMPYPFGLAEAEELLSRPLDPLLPKLLAFKRTNGAPQLVGGCGLDRRPSGAIELGYWIARDHWGHGFATEAGRALLEITRMLGHDQLEASHFLDNPASGRVLDKLGFEPLGIVAPRFSLARGVEAPARLLRLRFDRAEPLPGRSMAA